MPLLLKLPNCQRSIRRIVIRRGSTLSLCDRFETIPVTFYRGCPPPVPRTAERRSHGDGMDRGRQGRIDPSWNLLPCQPLATRGWLATDERLLPAAPSVETRNIAVSLDYVKRGTGKDFSRLPPAGKGAAAISTG